MNLSAFTSTTVSTDYEFTGGPGSDRMRLAKDIVNTTEGPVDEAKYCIKVSATVRNVRINLTSSPVKLKMLTLLLMHIHNNDYLRSH